MGKIAGVQGARYANSAGEFGLLWVKVRRIQSEQMSSEVNPLLQKPFGPLVSEREMPLKERCQRWEHTQQLAYKQRRQATHVLDLPYMIFSEIRYPLFWIML
jgi:hypothetical protein